MAKQRWATFSVADHIDITQLIPDILSFDRLIFPYPPDEKEWERWEGLKWQPDLLERRLRELVGIATSFDWDDVQRAQFSTRLVAARNPDKMSTPYAAYEEKTHIGRWERAKQATRDTIANAMKQQHGDDCWLLPRYGSLAALKAERSFSIPPQERQRRRERLTVLVGHQLELPWSANPRKAYELAIDLAKDAQFQQARRALNTKQEMTVLQEQSGKTDAQEFSDLVSDFNGRITARKRGLGNGGMFTRGWMFTMLKVAKELAEIKEKPLSTLFGAAIEVTETATEEKDAVPGPIAVFHHTQSRVFDPALH